RELRRSGPGIDLPEIPGLDPPGTVSALAAYIDGSPAPAPAPGRSVTPAPRTTLPSPRTLGDQLDGARIVVVCGSGGVGKTTISAAVAIRLAEGRDDVALLTVDPARRL